MDFELLMRSPITLALLGTNVIFSVIGFGNVRLLDSYTFDVGRIRRNKEWYRIVTSGFIHSGPIHLSVNMLSLFFIGPSVEYLLGGAVPFLLFYMACLVGSSVWELMDHWRNMTYRSLGASGALAGVVAGFGFIAPFTMILVLFVPMWAIAFAILYIIYSAWASKNIENGWFSDSGHLGGALTGVALICIFWPAYVQNTWQQILERLPF